MQTDDTNTTAQQRPIRFDVCITMIGMWDARVPLDEALFRLRLGDVWDLRKWIERGGMAHCMTVAGELVDLADLQPTLTQMGKPGEFRDGVFRHRDDKDELQ